MRPAQSRFKPGVVGRAMVAAAMSAATKFQKMSLRESGAFDQKFHTPEQVERIARGEKK